MNRSDGERVPRDRDRPSKLVAVSGIRSFDVCIQAPRRPRASEVVGCPSFTAPVVGRDGRDGCRDGRRTAALAVGAHGELVP